MDLLYIDIAVRGGATAVGLVLVVLIWTSRIAKEAQCAFTMVMVSTLFILWTKVAPILGVPDDVIWWMRFVNAGTTFAMTWFVLTIFLDDKRFFWAWLASGVLIWGWILITPIFPQTIFILRLFAALHFIALLALVFWSGVGDLQTARRKLRPSMSAFLLIYCIGQAFTSRPLQDMRTLDVQIWQSSTFLFFLMVFAVWSLKANLKNWPGEVDRSLPPASSAAETTLEQNALISRIQKEMGDDIWKVEGLTVGALASQVNAPEHQVRKAINQVLGYRNFASFINGARIEAAKRKLRSGDLPEKTVLEIAYDVGFSSLGPFNRAFKEATGQSPTDFRKTGGEVG